jgi:hypothetical protein
MKINTNLVLSALYGFEEDQLFRLIEPILDEYDELRGEHESTKIEILNINNEKQPVTHGVVYIRDKVTGSVYRGTSVVIGNRYRFAELLACCDAILSNHLSGVLALIGLVEQGIEGHSRRKDITLSVVS